MRQAVRVVPRWCVVLVVVAGTAGGGFGPGSARAAGIRVPEGLPEPAWAAATVSAPELPVTVTACGVTRAGRPIPVLLGPGMLDVRESNDRCRILLVAGADGSAAGVQAALTAWRRLITVNGDDDSAAAKFAFGLVPLLNPDGLAAQSGRVNSTGGEPGRGFGREARAYDDPRTPESIYLWRWLGMLAPDFVVVIESGEPGQPVQWRAAPVFQRGHADLTARLAAGRHEAPGSLVTALADQHPALTGPIPALELLAPDADSIEAAVRTALRPALGESGPSRSGARLELQRRLDRSPLDVARELSRHYGHRLDSVQYIPAVALIGRLRLSELTGDDSHRREVEGIVQPYRDGSKPSLAGSISGSHLAGHLVFGELARRTGDASCIERVRAAADLGFDRQGQPLPAMPFHSEMSDAVFMGTPILVQAGRLTGESRYFDMAARHLRFMRNLNLRNDGLHQHSPLDPEQTAWGRGNGFPALGLALSLTDLPEDSPHRPEMLRAFRDHLTAMRPHQDESGMWHQVVDRPESYRELTVTCMTTFAVVRGLRSGWLDRATFEPVARRAWPAISARIGSGGSPLVDVCTGTGKQKSLRDYYDRPAILGRDDRGGAMALLVATELATAERDGVVTPAAGQP